MAYARFDRRCDVYVYEDSNGGFTCERCGLPEAIGHTTNTRTLVEMFDHLLLHRKAGHKVPDEVINTIRKEIDDKKQSG